MNIQPTVLNRVAPCEGPEDWDHWQQLHVLPAIMRSECDDEIQSTSQSNREALGVLPSRYRCTLSLVAYRVLGDKQLAEDAVQRCLLSASRYVPQFENEGAFRSWLVRVLIDEALLILHDRDWVTHFLRTDQNPSYSINPESPVKRLF